MSRVEEKVNIIMYACKSECSQCGGGLTTDGGLFWSVYFFFFCGEKERDRESNCETVMSQNPVLSKNIVYGKFLRHS